MSTMNYFFSKLVCNYVKQLQKKFCALLRDTQTPAFCIWFICQPAEVQSADPGKDKKCNFSSLYFPPARHLLSGISPTIKENLLSGIPNELL